MPNITVFDANGSEHDLDAPSGVSLMQATTSAGIDGIVAECGGSAMCATCHVYIDSEWVSKLEEPLGNELDMLEHTAAERRPESRLSCQIILNDEMEGLIVRVPETQY